LLWKREVQQRLARKLFRSIPKIILTQFAAKSTPLTTCEYLRPYLTENTPCLHYKRQAVKVFMETTDFYLDNST